MTLSQLGQAMIMTVLENYPNKMLEIANIKKMAKRQRQVSFFKERHYLIIKNCS